MIKMCTEHTRTKKKNGGQSGVSIAVNLSHIPGASMHLVENSIIKESTLNCFPSACNIKVTYFFKPCLSFFFLSEKSLIYSV